MKTKFIFTVFFLLISVVSVYGDKPAFKDKEYLKYRIHYGPLNAGYATLNVNETTLNGKPHYHCKGYGWTVGAVKLFFKVEDDYQTYIDKNTLLPSKFIRKINEGGYKKDLELDFNHQQTKVVQKDKKNNKTTTHSITKDVQDMLSAFYYLRNYDTSNLKTGDVIKLNIFIDDENNNFQLKVLGRETIKSKYGKIKCLKIRPYVQSGRVFKAKESVTMWISDDENKVPIEIKAELAVGSLKASIDDYRGLNSKL